MSRILITGVDGFTGKHLSHFLMEGGHDVHGIMRNPEGKNIDGKVIVHQAELSDKDRLAQVMDQVSPDKIVHLAAISFVAHGDADAIYNTNLIGTRNLIEAAVRSTGHISAILLASSANIYGNQDVGAIDESIKPFPANDYSVSKLAMEYMADLYRDRIPLIIARPFNYTGVGQGGNFLIPKIIDHVQRRAPRIELGNIDIERDWSDVRMVIQAYARLLDTPEAVGQTVNVCSGRATNLRGLIALACDLAGHRMEIDVNPAFVRANEVRSLCGSNQRLRDLIGALPDYPIEETMKWMLAAA